MMIRKNLVISFCLLLGLTACGSNTTVVDQSDQVPVDNEITQADKFSWQGTIKPVSNSLVAEGTHVLLSETNEFIAELFSRTIDLTAYENVEVNLTGIPHEMNGRMLVEVTKITAANGDPVADLWTVLPDLVLDYEPEVEWETAEYQLVESSASAGTAMVLALVDEDYYTVKLVRKDDPVIGEWEIYSLYEATSDEIDLLTETEDEETEEDEASEEDEEEETDEESEEESADDEDSEEEEEKETVVETTPVNIDPKVSESSVKESTIQAVISGVPGFLKTAHELETAPALTQMEFASPNFVYVTYVTAEGEQMSLLTYTQQDDGLNFSEKATFISGDVSDWEIDSGVNSAKNLAKDIFVAEGGEWDFIGNVSEGASLYTWSSTGVTFEVPFVWYYWQRGNSVAFSNQPVEEDNILAEVYYSTKSVDAALASFEGEVTRESPLSVGDYTGTKQVLSDGNVRYAVNYGDFSLIAEAKTNATTQVENLLATVTQ